MFSVVYVPAKTDSYSLFCVQQVEAPQISDRTDWLGSGFVPSWLNAHIVSHFG